MNHLPPNEQPLKMNFIEITPDNVNDFKSKKARCWAFCYSDVAGNCGPEP